MKIVVFGATGTIGKHLVKQSLEQGHEVTAFCRNKTKLQEFNHSNLQIVEGDVLNQLDVCRAIQNGEVVIIALGSGKSRKSTVRSQGTKYIITAMKENGVQRLICQSTLGTYESNANLNFFWKHIMFGWYLKNIFQDHELQEKFVKESELDWTIVRPGAFTNGAKTGNYQHGFSPKEKSLKLKISRSDVADFILKQLVDLNYLYKTPGLSY